jgi:hypothetical protein
MKSIAKIICCGVALAWMVSATAAEEAAGAAAPDDVVVPTPPAPRIAVKPYHDKVDRAKVERRLDDKSARTRKRAAEAEKDAAERAARQQANPAPAGR